MGRLPDSYTEAHRYDQAVIDYGRRPGGLVPCEPQPRDAAIVHDVWRHKFLTTPQLCELWWPGRTERAGQVRLTKLFEAGYLERFRPRAGRGSFPWTYQLGAEGHCLLRETGSLEGRERFNRKQIYDYRYVLHELHLNACIMAWRRALGRRLVRWDGETLIEPPPDARKGQLRLADDWSAQDLRDPRARQLKPDALLETARDDSPEARLFLIEFDRTRRVDKNYEKFRRYDAFLTWWWRHTPLGERAEAPFVLFVCPDSDQRRDFMQAADRELTGHRWHPSVAPERHEYEGRRRILFAVEVDVHTGQLEAWRLPAFPAGHPARSDEIRRVRLPGQHQRREAPRPRLLAPAPVLIEPQPQLAV